MRCAIPYLRQLTCVCTVYANPLVLALWVGLSCVFVQFMQWWPKPEQGILGFLTPIPAFGTLSIVFMFAIDW